jgi:hypothetical protein
MNYDEIQKIKATYANERKWGEEITVEVAVTIPSSVATRLVQDRQIVVPLYDLLGNETLKYICDRINRRYVPSTLSDKQITPSTLEISLTGAAVHDFQCDTASRGTGMTVLVPVAESIAHDNSLHIVRNGGTPQARMLGENYSYVEGLPVATIVGKGAGNTVLMNENTQPSVFGSSFGEPARDHTHMCIYHTYDNGVKPSPLNTVSINKAGAMTQDQCLNVEHVHIIRPWCEGESHTLSHEQYSNGVANYLNAQLNSIRHGSFLNTSICVNGAPYTKVVGDIHFVLELKFRPLIYAEYDNPSVAEGNSKNFFQRVVGRFI